MSDPMPPPNPLTELLEAERDLPGVPPDRVARIRAGVEASVGPLGPSGGGTGGQSGGGGAPRGRGTWIGHAVTAAVSLAVGGMAGAAIHAVFSDAPPTDASAVVESAPSATLEDTARSERPRTTEKGERAESASPRAAALAQEPPAGQPSARRGTGTGALPSGTSLADERRLLDAARASLVRDHAPQALATLERHERLFADGELAEERDVLAVQALVDTGRHAEALERAERFRSAYPNSFMLAVVDRAIQRLEMSPPGETDPSQPE